MSIRAANPDVHLTAGTTELYDVTVTDSLTSAPVTSATVSISVLDKHRTTLATYTATHLGGGVYRATKPHTLSVTPGEVYYIRGTAVDSSSAPQTLFEVTVVARYAPTV